VEAQKTANLKAILNRAIIIIIMVITDFKLYYRTVVTKPMCHWQKKKNRCARCVSQ
jgi:hypothetical protein